MNRKFIFFDTETTGLPDDFDAPITDVDNWPRIVQISWIMTDDQNNLIKEKDFIIKPEGYEIPYESSEIHGITTEKAMTVGLPMKDVMTTFVNDVKSCDVVVGHNVEFDINVSRCEAFRLGWSNPFKGKQVICTMLESTAFCAIPGWYGDYKWPRLQELHKALFGCYFEDAHNSKADIEATARCFWELVRKGIIEL